VQRYKKCVIFCIFSKEIVLLLKIIRIQREYLLEFSKFAA